jgi:GNAT superfamily N-acetyltransferase
MFWRIPRKQYEANKGGKNKRAFQKIVTNDEKPGIIAYRGKEPVGWCAVAPRDVYIGLERSRILKPVDDQPVWSVSCLFVRKEYRRQGVSSILLRAAVEFAARRGAKIVEGYPAGTSNDKDGRRISLARCAFGISCRRVRRGCTSFTFKTNHALFD